MGSRKHLVNNVMFIVGVSYFVVLVAVSIALLTISRPVSALIFFLIALPFVLLAFRYGSTVTFDENGVNLRFLGIKRNQIRWKDLKDVCVCGTRVLNRINRNKCGTIYMIFTDKHIPENKLLDMMLKWPPKGKIYLKFTKDRLLEVQMHWSRPVQKFNIGSLDI
ncbi:MAG: hypothetical protein IKP61_09255 [Spirochaetales bacterium]|nr:hypothetical protein [Spirochaetales bacterium]